MKTKKMDERNNGGLVIEHGVPIPDSMRWGPGRPKYPFEELGVGDSFFIPGGTDIQRQTAYQHGRRHGKKFKVALLTEHGVKGVRVWRME